MVHPVFYHMRVAQLRLHRRLQDWFRRTRFACTRAADTLPHACNRHQSLLRRKLGSTNPQWQENKIVNLRLAVKPIDGLLIRPGETFSFWAAVGDTTARKGYLPGMELWEDRAVAGIGGGICQLANLLYWMALHTPLTVVERQHHSFDPFPDDQRALPFGAGASVFFNYVDLRFYNPTEQTFQLCVHLTDTHLKGSIYTDQPWPLAYHLEERNHRFLTQEGKNYRENDIFRRVVDVRSGAEVRVEHLMHNFSEVKYELFELNSRSD